MERLFESSVMNLASDEMNSIRGGQQQQVETRKIADAGTSGPNAQGCTDVITREYSDDDVFIEECATWTCVDKITK